MFSFKKSGRFENTLKMLKYALQNPSTTKVLYVDIFKSGSFFNLVEKLTHDSKLLSKQASNTFGTL